MTVTLPHVYIENNGSDAEKKHLRAFSKTFCETLVSFLCFDEVFSSVCKDVNLWISKMLITHIKSVFIDHEHAHVLGQ